MIRIPIVDIQSPFLSHEILLNILNPIGYGLVFFCEMITFSRGWLDCNFQLTFNSYEADGERLEVSEVMGKSQVSTRSVLCSGESKL